MPGRFRSQMTAVPLVASGGNLFRLAISAARSELH